MTRIVDEVAARTLDENSQVEALTMRGNIVAIRDPGRGPTVAFGDSLRNAFVAVGADHTRRLRTRRALGARIPTDSRIMSTPSPMRNASSNSDRADSDKDHRWVLLQCVTWSFHNEDPADGRLLHAAPPFGPQTPPPQGTHLDVGGVAARASETLMMIRSCYRSVKTVKPEHVVIEWPH